MEKILIGALLLGVVAFAAVGVAFAGQAPEPQAQSVAPAPCCGGQCGCEGGCANPSCAAKTGGECDCAAGECGAGCTAQVKPCGCGK